MKVRIFQNSDGTVAFNYPSPQFQGGHFDKDGKELTVFDCPIPADFQGVPFVVKDADSLPDSNSQKGNYHERIYHENGELKEDLTWDKCVMPDCLVQEDHIAKEQAKLNDELAKDSPDPVAALKAQNELRNAVTNDKLYWAEKALAGLDKRVADGKLDKATIRLKLQQKIAKLKLG